MVGGLSFIVSLVLAEIAAAFPTAGGIYFWSYRLGGEEWGPFLAWMTAWWNWAGWVCVVPGGKFFSFFDNTQYLFLRYLSSILFLVSVKE